MTLAITTPQQLWTTALGELELQMTRATFDTWLRDTQCIGRDEDNTLVITVKNGYAVEWLENRLYPVIERTLQRVTGNGTLARFVINEPKRARPTVTLPDIPATYDLVAELADVLRNVIDPATRKLLQERIAAIQGVPEPEPPTPPVDFDTYGKAGGGWYPISNYADAFWKPLLRERKAFLTYTTIRALDKNAASSEWTQMKHVPIREIMQRVPCSRNTILGEMRGGVYRSGALDMLREAGLARLEVHGDDKHTTYHVSVVTKLPLLTAVQAQQLSDELQAQHRAFLVQHSIDPTPWEPD